MHAIVDAVVRWMCSYAGACTHVRVHVWNIEHVHTLSHARSRIDLKSETSITICGEDFFDWVDVGGRSQVQTQIVFHGRFHDGTGRTLHCVIQSRMYDILFWCAWNALLKWFRWGDGNFTTNTSKATLQRLLHRFYKSIGNNERTPK